MLEAVFVGDHVTFVSEYSMSELAAQAYATDKNLNHYRFAPDIALWVNREPGSLYQEGEGDSLSTTQRA